MARSELQTTVTTYTREMREFFAMVSGPTGFEAPGGLPEEELDTRAQRLAALSASLTEQNSEFLSAEDSVVRLGAENHLLALAALSLRVADELLLATANQDTMAAAADDTLASLVQEQADVSHLLVMLETSPERAGIEAMGVSPAATAEVPTATPAELVMAADQTMEAVLNGVSTLARDGLAGMVGLDTALLKQAAKLISAELGEAVEKLGETASRLVARAVTFVLQAYDSLLAALGQEVTSELRAQVAEWVQRLQQGSAMAEVLDAILETQDTRQRIAELIEASQAEPEILGQTRAGVEALQQSFTVRTRLVGQILAALAVVKRIPAARIPQIELASAAVYLLLIGFTLYVGADYVDAPKLERLNRVAGVLHTVETGLAAS